MEPTQRKPSSTRAFGLIDVLAAAGILLTAALGLASCVTVGVSEMRLADEKAAAIDAAHQAIERMQNGEIDFNQLFTTYRDAEPGTKHSLEFIASLPTTKNKGKNTGKNTGNAEVPKEIKGNLSFPMGGADGTELREDLAGIDLNGDGVIDDLDHSTDYVLLPVKAQLEWDGVAGDKNLTFETILTKP